MTKTSTLRKIACSLAFAIPAFALNAQTVFFSWADQFGGTGYDYATSLAVDNLGNSYTTGVFRNTVDFDPGSGTSNLTSAGQEDIYVLKTDAFGALVWAVRIGGTGGDIGNEIAVDANGYVYVAGEFESTVDFDPGAGTSNLTSPANTASFIVKLTPAGNFSWARMIGSNQGTTATGLVVDASGVSHLAGMFNGDVDLDPGAGTQNETTVGQNDFYIIELDSAGIMQWAKAFGGSSIDQMEAIAQDVNGDLYVTGFFMGTADFQPGGGTTNLTASGTDIFVAKYLGSNGSLDWAVKMGGSGGDGGSDIAVDPTGNVYTTGYFDGTADFDPGSGSVTFTAGTGISDAFVSCLTSTGAYSWAAQLGGSSVDAGQSIYLDVTGNVYTTGRFSGTADFDPSGASNTLTSSGTYDVYLSKLSSTGAYVWAHHLGGASNDNGNAIAVDASNNVYVTGYFAGTADMDPQGSSWPLTSNGQDDIMLVKFSQSGVGVEESATVNGLTVFPNPTSGLITLTLENPASDNVVRVYAVTGEMMMERKITGATMQLDLTEFAHGAYFIQVSGQNGTSTVEVLR